ncbi:branched-chain amino acid ABC transporter permease [Paraburkholderia ultramafica]|nr:branched-chain amino acid ABC transporter permease [Paraburkholderia ultramafica]
MLMIALLCVLLAAGAFTSDYVSGIVAEILIFGIFAMSLNLLVGYTGLMSFGHAAFFGMATYTVIGLGVHLGISGWWGALAAIVVSTALAALIGAFCIRVTGIPFLMLTMAFSQLLFAGALKWRSVSGGTDGLTGFVPPELFGVSLAQSAGARYAVVAVGFLLVLVFLNCLVRSPLGSIFIGIRDNEQRMRAIGYPVQRFKLLAFTIAGGLAGVGGALYALFNAYVSSDILHWQQSGDAMIMVVLGGSGTVIGPAVGAGIFLLLKTVISSHNEYWALWVGAIFIVCVMFLREGVWGYIAGRLGNRTIRSRIARARSAPTAEARR